MTPARFLPLARLLALACLAQATQGARASAQQTSVGAPGGEGAAEEVEGEGEEVDPQDDDGERSADALPAFEARARIERPATAEGARTLPLAEARDLPGAVGDPLRAIEMLPGVVPIASGLPYFSYRGAPPSATIFVYDGIPVPALFHLAFGPSVVHPRMLGDLDVYPAVAPARYGGLAGGAIAAAGPGRISRTEGEAELRLLDVNGYVSVREGPVGVAGSIRIGYPGLLLAAIQPGIELSYGDVQLRASLDLSSADRIELVWLGSHDRLASGFSTSSGVALVPDGAIGTETEMAFMRGELRLVHDTSDLQLGVAFRLGWERSGYTQFGTPGLNVEAITLGPRLWLTARPLAQVVVRAGGQLIGALGQLDSLQETPELGIGTGQIFASQYGRARRRSLGSLYGEVTWEPIRQLRADLGVRGDLWITGSALEASLDPRMRLSVRPIPQFALHVGGAVARQPAVLAIPLPGLAELPLDNGLLTAVQGEVGVRVDLDDRDVEVHTDVRAFVSRYTNLFLADVAGGGTLACHEGMLCTGVPTRPNVSALAYGGELLVRVRVLQVLSVFASYTLSELLSAPYVDVPYRPTLDVRHVINAGLSASFEGFTAAIRLHARSGAPRGFYYLERDLEVVHRYEQELPWFVRSDASVAYRWDAGWGHVRVSLDWLNWTLFLPNEQLDIACDTVPSPGESCPTYGPLPVFFPNLGVRVEVP